MSLPRDEPTGYAFNGLRLMQFSELGVDLLGIGPTAAAEHPGQGVAAAARDCRAIDEAHRTSNWPS